MTLAINQAELRAVASTTFRWVDDLKHGINRVGRSRDAAGDLASIMQRISKEAVGISWGTPAETSSQLPGLIGAINEVAIHAGTVDAASGAAKPGNAIEALRAATRAHGQVQTELMERGWHPNGHEFYWPT